MALQGKKILLGVCGSISAYKAAYLIRLLVKHGATVQVIMTQGAKAFISPLTLSTLSKRPVLTEYFDEQSGEWNNHVQWAEWADMLLIAPITAHTLAKLANGYCNTLLEAVYLSCTCPVLLSPAMDLDMWKHPSTKHNLERLTSYGNSIIPPESGELASGLVGEGRLPEPEVIVEFILDFFKASTTLYGVKVLVTAGSTYEPIDPVRFIGNHSSGKMGYAIAEVLCKQGADVTLISGPSALQVPKGLRFVSVDTAQQMYEATSEYFDSSQITIMSAAVADYTPEKKADQKIKKTESDFSINLVKTKDILAELGTRKKENQFLVGFALETENAVANATDKLRRKNLDIIVLNTLEDEGAGFGYDTNRVKFILKNGAIEQLPLKSKNEVAKDLIQLIISEIEITH